MFLWVLNREACTHGRVLRAPHYKYITYTWFVENNNSALKPSPPRHVFCFLLRSVVSVVFGVFFFFFCFVPHRFLSMTRAIPKKNVGHTRCICIYIYKKKTVRKQFDWAPRSRRRGPSPSYILFTWIFVFRQQSWNVGLYILLIVRVPCTFHIIFLLYTAHTRVISIGNFERETRVLQIKYTRVCMCVRLQKLSAVTVHEGSGSIGKPVRRCV